MPRARLLAAVVCAAAVVRFAGLGYSVPFHFHIDEQLLLTSTASLACHPRDAVLEKYFFNYGSVPRMMAGAPLAVADAAGRLHLDRRSQVRAFYVVARSISALAGTLTVLVVGLVALSLVDSPAALVAPLLLAFSPLHLRDSHFFTPDSLLTLFITATLASACWLLREKSLRAAAIMGACAGLAVATKINAVFALGAAPAALLFTRRRSAAAAACAAFLAAFLAGNWPILLAPGEFFRGMGLLASWASGEGIRQPDLQFVGTPPWLYWVGNLLRYGAGPVFWVLGVAGMVFLAWRPNRQAALLAATGFPYFLIMGASFQKFMRFSLPLHPVLALAAALLLATLCRRNRVISAAAGLLLLLHVLVGLAYAGVFLREDPRIRAGRELSETLPVGTPILLETTHSNPPLLEEDRHTGLFDSYLPALGQPLVRRSGRFELLYLDPYVYFYERVSEPDSQWACISRALDEADVVIVGDRYRDQYTRLPHRFPVLARYYRQLEDGSLGFIPCRVYENRPRLGCFAIDDQASELTFRLFDRPVLVVYARPGSPAWRVLCVTAP